VTVFAEAEELVADPSLVKDYVGAFSAADDVTLVTVAREWDGARLGEALAPLEQLLAFDGAPDVVAAPADQRARANALTRADCVLGDVPVPGMRCFGDAAELRAFVEHRWRFPVRTR
ncbi:MAG TPA: hypothetical protein VFG79_25170, partial [Solirubrobacter sp.]|nr:hypothetical protein [Solirubrobacter sp.]